MPKDIFDALLEIRSLYSCQEELSAFEMDLEDESILNDAFEISLHERFHLIEAALKREKEKE